MMGLVPISVSRIPLIILCSPLPFKKYSIHIVYWLGNHSLASEGRDCILFWFSFILWASHFTSVSTGFFICKMGKNDLIEFLLWLNAMMHVKCLVGAYYMHVVQIRCYHFFFFLSIWEMIDFSLLSLLGTEHICLVMPHVFVMFCSSHYIDSLCLL